MTRKDYEMIAATIKARRMFTQSADAVRTLDNVATALAMEFAQDNPEFKYDRFRAACGCSQ